MARCIMFLLLAAAGSVVARAGVVINVDLDDTQPGIQSTLAVSPGATVRADFLLTLTGTTSLSGYNFSAMFDTAELTFVSRSESPPPNYGFSESDASDPVNGGLMTRFGAFTLSAGPTAASDPGPFVVATAIFTTSAVGGDEFDIDILPGRFEPMFDLFIDNNSAPINDVVFNGASVTAVPEPGMGGLFAIASSLMFFRNGRHRNRRAAL